MMEEDPIMMQSVVSDDVNENKERDDRSNKKYFYGSIERDQGHVF